MAFRVDIGTLRPPVRLPDGRVRVEAHITRAGVFNYLNPDGSLRRELRDPSEVFNADSLRSFEQLPVTNTHPYEQVTAKNARQHMVGANDSSVTRDDDHVRTMLMVADEATIAEMDAKKKVQVSCGYTCDFDPTPGTHPLYGAYDGKQKNIRGNHIALVEHGRAGTTARVRMDATAVKDYAVMVAEGSVFTSITKGHQHSIDPEDASSSGYSRRTTGAIASGEDVPHSHEWMMGPDGKVIISTNDGHTHTAEIVWKPGETVEAVAVSDHAKGGTTRISQNPRAKEIDMAEKIQPSALETATQQLALETTRADAAEIKISDLDKLLKAANERADVAEGALAGCREQLAEAQTFKLDQVKLDEATAKVAMLTKALEDEKAARIHAEDPKRMDEAVQKRMKIVRAAAAVCGEKFNCDGINDQNLMVEVLTRLGKAPDPKESAAHIEARFDERVSNFDASERAVARVRMAAHNEQQTKRTDTVDDARKAMIERKQSAWQQAK